MRFIFPVIYFTLFIELARFDPEVWSFVLFSFMIYLAHLSTDKEPA